MNGVYDTLLHDLHCHIGKKINISLHTGISDGTQINRKFLDCKFIPTHSGLTIILEMEDYNTKEKIVHVLSDVQNAKYDRAMPIDGDTVKYHLTHTNNLLNNCFISSLPESRNAEYFKQFQNDKKLDDMYHVTSNIYLIDNSN
jgi:hypothetical protein